MKIIVEEKKTNVDILHPIDFFTGRCNFIIGLSPIFGKLTCSS